MSGRKLSGEGQCKSCGALVLWVTMVKRMPDGTTVAGRAMPLDTAPRLDGDIERKQGLHRDRWYGRVVPVEERRSPLYVSHFSTCPEAEKHRRSYRGIHAIHEDGGK